MDKKPTYHNLEQRVLELEIVTRSLPVMKTILAPKVLDLNNTLESTLKMMRRLIGEDIDLSMKKKQL